MTITGTIPSAIAAFLKTEDESLKGIEIKNSDIDVVFNDDGKYTELYAVGTGNGSYEIVEIDDNLNMFPAYSEGDVLSNDVLKKVFSTAINSSLILSWNPLGRIKYGVQELGKNIKDVGTKVADWAADRLYAEDAEKWIRGHGPYRRTFTDSRDGKTRTKKDYSAGRVNVGKIESLGKMGHYKVLTGNPATKDYQVWHLYKNGNKISCLDVKTGLQGDEAVWVYDNNIPDSWSESDWNPDAAEEDNMFEQTETTEETSQSTENTSEESQKEDNVVEESEQTEEDNLEEIGDPEDWFDTESTGADEEDNLVEEPKKKKTKKKVTAALIKSSVEDDDSDFSEDIEEDNVIDSSAILSTTGQGGEIEGPDATESEPDVEEDNVIESKPKKKSKYYGRNVTGCTQPDGTVVMASLITEDLKQFIEYTGGLKNVKEDVLEQWKEIKDLLLDIATLDKETLKNMTKQSGDNLIIDFNETGTGQNYTITIELTPNRMNITDKVAPGREYEHLIQSLKTVKQKLEPKF